MDPIKILFITTSHDVLGDTGTSTGVWLEELAAPYYAFTDIGALVTIASPAGGAVPLEPKSQSIIVATRHTKRFLQDAEAMELLTHSLRVDQTESADFDAVYLPGGHGAIWDIADNTQVKQLLEAFNNAKKTIGAISHGVAGLLAMQTTQGELLLAGKQVTGASDSESESAGLAKATPFLLEWRLRSIGALFSKGPDYTSFIVTDNNIITGQNPASAYDLARKILDLVRNTNNKTIDNSPSLIT